MIERQQTTWLSGSLGAMLLLLIGLAVLLPLALVIVDSVPRTVGGLETFRAELVSPPLQQAFVHSIAVALLACVLASVVAVPLAWWAARGPRAMYGMAGLLGIVPLAIPPFLGAALLERFAAAYNQTAWADVLGTLEVHGSRLALAVVFALHYFPLILFSLMAGLRRIPRAYAESARNLGAGPLTVWRRITLPLATVPYAAGAALLVLKVIEDVGTPLVLGADQLLAPQLLLQLGDPGAANATLPLTAVTLLLVSLIVTVLAWSALLPPLGTAVPPIDRPSRSAGRLPALLSTAAVLILALIALAPLLWLVLLALAAPWPTSFHPPAVELFADRTTTAITVTFAATSALLTTLLGLAATVVTLTRTRLANLVRFALAALFAVPGAVLAIGFMHLTELPGLLPAGRADPAWFALVLVVAFKQLPLAVHILMRPLARLGRGGLESARSVRGRGPGLYLGVALPAVGRALVAVLLLGAAGAALELSAALVLIKDPQTLAALHLFDTIRSAADGASWAAQGIPLVFAATVAGALGWILLYRRAGAPAPAKANHDPLLREPR